MKSDEEFSEEETARRRDAVLKIMVNTPPQPRTRKAEMTESTKSIRNRAFELAKSGKYRNWQAIQTALETSRDGVSEALDDYITRASIDRECELATGRPAQGTRFRTAAGLRAKAADARGDPMRRVKSTRESPTSDRPARSKKRKSTDEGRARAKPSAR